MFQAGWSRQEIQIEAKGYAMFGYGSWQHRAYKKRTPLYVRTVVIQDHQEKLLIFSCLDFGCITHAMRSEVVAELKKQMADLFCEERFVMTATHTHSGPGGCAYEALYNMPTPGFVPEHLHAVVYATVSSIQHAVKVLGRTEICMSTTHFSEDVPVAWNRSLNAWNRNPDVQQRKETETHLAMNREMQLLGFYRDGQLHAFISLFGVHATCLGNTLNAHDGDNKGYAAEYSEQYLLEQGIHHPVAIFAQATAGDISPHFHGKNQLKIREAIKGEQEYQYAQKNGRYQSEQALEALMKPGTVLSGELDAVLSYTDLSNVDIPLELSHGVKHARTSIPCHGVAFFAGTPVDGPGTAKPIVRVMSFLSQQYKKQKLRDRMADDFDFYQQLFASQGVKSILMESGIKRILGKPLGFAPGFIDPLVNEINRQVKAGAIRESPLVPSVVPLQMIQIGQLRIVCCPGELTTTAGKRVLETIVQNTSDQPVWLASYCNDYMGYVTTYEEYQEQAYEGGHTLFGQWTNAAFQLKFSALAQQLENTEAQRQHDRTTRPAEVPLQELLKRTNRGNLKTAVSE
ncbi:neutral/alkaline non-lysosomal ceramidase N-terminal domain-containing protein [Acinetobacter chinensis]|uniref:Neutral ceramidase n=1 Tax=Acinetobacter chinensis TaxID=2004650 RepID=A0ABU3WIT3_9GAMM|nr:neutral/alkaline non-lysosomal ceramidase N-terminal domain-containing protein [Acinetobacter chinensis]MDV2470320.1 neutral/alkaline non-lysosomal ceramidase N-terminal domain-containing protein [Acinetobacter chinensis]